MQLKHLSKSARLEETADPTLSRFIIYTISVVLFALFVWSAFATVPEVARASGQISPIGVERDVQHPIGGTLAQLSAVSGQEVREGDLLAVIDDTNLLKELEASRKTVRNLSIQIERLSAYTEDREADFSEFGGMEELDVAQAAETLRAMNLAHQDRRSVALRQREQKDQDLAALREQKETAVTNLAALRDLLTRNEQLYDQGLIVFSEIVDLRRRVREAEGNISVLTERLSQIEVARREYDARLASIGSTERSQALQELQQYKADLDDASAQVIRYETELAQTRILAPVSGRIKIGDDVAIGDYVSSGNPILQIVPQDEQLVARVRVNARDIGRIRIGQPVQVKVSAYDFLRFGTIPGKISTISASAFASEQGAYYFTAEVDLEQDHVGGDPSGNLLAAGMTVSADIINGQQTLFEYFLKPIRLALAEAFTEE